VAARAGFTGVGIGYLDLLDAEKQYGYRGTGRREAPSLEGGSEQGNAQLSSRTVK